MGVPSDHGSAAMMAAAPITSAGRFSPLGPLGIGLVLARFDTHAV